MMASFDFKVFSFSYANFAFKARVKRRTSHHYPFDNLFWNYPPSVVYNQPKSFLRK